jgi:hypothetical protein
MMNRSNQILSVVLVVQLILVGIVFFPKSDDEVVASGPLLADFSADDVSELRVTDAEGTEIHLTRNDIGLWVLPEYDDFPARPETVVNLLGRLEDLQTNRLIAQNSSSHNRLRVGADEFEREIDINGGDERLFIGTTAGANATHMRVDGDDRVFLTGGLSAFDANVSLSAWINSQYVSIPSENVTALSLENANGVFEFVKEDEEWVYLGLGEDETFNPQAFNTLLNQSTAVRMTAPVSREEDESFGMDEPRATITLTVTEIVEPEAPDTNATEEPTEPETVDTIYTLTLGSLVEEADFAFKASDQEYYVRVSANTANGFVDRSHEGFLIIPEEEPEATPEGE